MLPAELHETDVAAEYESLIDFMYQAPVGLVRLDIDGTIEMLNPMAARLLLPVAPEAGLTNLFDALQGVAPGLRALVADFAAASGTICADHRLVLAPGGEPQELSLTLLRQYPARLMVVVQDVSVSAANERRLRASEELATTLNRELEERVERRTEQLRRSLDEMASFTYAVAHDLRTPLRTIAGFASLMRMEDAVPAAERGELLVKISDAAHRMASQIDGLLKLSQISHADLALRRNDLSQMARAAIAACREAHPERVVDVAIENGMDCHSDPALLRDMLEHLVANAWKFTEKTPAARIEVGTRERDGVSGFYVADNGAGFDMRYASRLFEVFQRMHRQEEFAGVGIGLALVRRVVERHGGAIHADASPGKGATFWFSLPG